MLRDDEGQRAGGYSPVRRSAGRWKPPQELLRIKTGAFDSGSAKTRMSRSAEDEVICQCTVRQAVS